MDRESLRPLVEAQFGESHLTVLSEETINAELDEALEGITDDAQVDDAFTKKLATRLLRLNGNVTSEAGKQINDWKKKHPTPKLDTKPKPNEGDKTNEDEKSELQKLLERVEAMEQANKQRTEAAAKDAIIDDVKKGFKAKFKEANIEVNDYIFRQTIRDLEIPELEEGEKANIGDLVKSLERDYLKNLKEAGLGKEDTSKPRYGGRGGTGKNAADRFFEKKGKKEGWKK